MAAARRFTDWVGPTVGFGGTPTSMVPMEISTVGVGVSAFTVVAAGRRGVSGAGAGGNSWCGFGWTADSAGFRSAAFEDSARPLSRGLPRGIGSEKGGCANRRREAGASVAGASCVGGFGVLAATRSATVTTVDGTFSDSFFSCCGEGAGLGVTFGSVWDTNRRSFCGASSSIGGAGDLDHGKTGGVCAGRMPLIRCPRLRAVRRWSRSFMRVSSPYRGLGEQRQD